MDSKEEKKVSTPGWLLIVVKEKIKYIKKLINKSKQPIDGIPEFLKNKILKQEEENNIKLVYIEQKCINGQQDISAEDINFLFDMCNSL